MMNQSFLGRIVEVEWMRTLSIRNDLTSTCHVTMPNHFHALLGITKNNPTSPSYLPNIVVGFKGAVSLAARKAGFEETVWQRNYHEHIVRNQEEWTRIADYIQDNPRRWNEDRYNPLNPNKLDINPQD